MITKFFTKQGIEVPSVSAEQMRTIDRIAVEETGPNLFQMMENAGRNLALLAMETASSHWQSKRYLILAGKGGNGGGGICAARHLLNRRLNVTVCLSSEDLKNVPLFQFQTYVKSGGDVRSFDQVQRQQFDVIIDALIGYGLKSAPKNVARQMIEWANRQDAVKISLDIPSGVNATTGAIQGVFFFPDKTLTLALPKTGLSSQTAGRIFLADLGIPEAIYRRLGLNYRNPFARTFTVELVDVEMVKG